MPSPRAPGERCRPGERVLLKTDTQSFGHEALAGADRSFALIDAVQVAVALDASRDFEARLSDGGSRNLTAALARSFADKLPRLALSLRPDGAVYDAINMALLLS